MVSSEWWSFQCFNPRTKEQQKWTDVHASAARTDVQPVASTVPGHQPEHCSAAEGRRDLVCLAQGGWCDTIVQHVPFCVCVLDEHGHSMLHAKSIDANGLPYHDCLSQIMGCDLTAVQEQVQAATAPCSSVSVGYALLCYHCSRLSISYPRHSRPKELKAPKAQAQQPVAQ
ncbi:hypothetical protein HaLaN_20160 [Haematococcus lacustris]|uniref:Uncharacterized protein n=1 Tax=Haematococcus lacustris TaxID=44745 RepID=A0A6A0A182_HAELA|nr:hypothetical protein HaLaN_20160 [Haematococcus lacustris]